MKRNLYCVADDKHKAMVDLDRVVAMTLTSKTLSFVLDNGGTVAVTCRDADLVFEDVQKRMSK